MSIKEEDAAVTDLLTCACLSLWTYLELGAGKYSDQTLMGYLCGRMEDRLADVKPNQLCFWRNSILWETRGKSPIPGRKPQSHVSKHPNSRVKVRKDNLRPPAENRELSHPVCQVRLPPCLVPADYTRNAVVKILTCWPVWKLSKLAVTTINTLHPRLRLSDLLHWE